MTSAVSWFRFPTAITLSSSTGSATATEEHRPVGACPLGALGVRFVPDVLIRPTLSPVTEVLPIEVKFLQKASSASQCVATAIGQGAYTVRYPRSIVFVGVRRGLTKGRFALANLSGVAGDEAKLRTLLDEKGVHLILREVGT